MDNISTGWPCRWAVWEREPFRWAAVCGSLRNFIGKDGSRFTSNWKGDFIPVGAVRNRNEYRDTDGVRGIYFYSEGVDAKDPAWGTMALVTQADAAEVSWRTSSKPDDWNNAILNFWDDFSADGRLTELEQPVREDDPMASLAVQKTVAPGSRETFTFYLTWHFPDRKAWAGEIVGNYYCRQYTDAWDAAKKILPQVPRLEQETLDFVNALLSSTIPDVVQEAALFNLSTLRSQTVFRLPDGHLMGWEGVMDRFGSCQGTCTHVWNYEVATPFLFGELAQTMRDVELNYATKENGLMNFRAALPLSEAAKRNAAAADGQMGCVMKVYREWQLSGDRAFLERNWEQTRKILSYAWTERGWDGNRNGEYYEHRITDPKTFEFLNIDSAGVRVPDFQLGKGCLVDQLVGQYMAHICGLGYLADPAHIRTTLKSIMKYNFVPDFSRHFNNMRSYVMGDEAGLLMASWPKGRLEVPFPYFAEVMTGFEYCAAVGMKYEGMDEEALRCFTAIRDRFDGAKRNPFDEAECGHHYARAMASWAGVLAWSGFHYSGVERQMTFTDRPGKYFWSNGYAWGTCEVSRESVTLELLKGELRLKQLKIGDKVIRLKDASWSPSDSKTFRL